MKSLTGVLFTTALTFGAAVSGALHAQAAATAPATEYTEAEVRRVDKDNRKITLKHGEIRNLHMSPMTMVFHLHDAAALDRIKAGDKVRFKATSEGGKYTVTEIQAVK